MEDARVKAQQLLGGEELVVISQLRQVADALARDGFPHVRAEEIRRAAGRVHEAQQHVHGRGLARSVRAEEAEDFALPDGEIQPLQGDLQSLPHFLGAEFAEALEAFNLWQASENFRY